MRTTQRKGDLAVTQAIATFTRLGFDVALPITESAAYDIIVDSGDGLWRVQVKFYTGQNVDLRNIHSNASGWIVKKCAENAYDWLYVYRGTDGAEFLIKDCLAGRATVRPKEADRLGGADIGASSAPEKRQA